MSGLRIVRVMPFFEPRYGGCVVQGREVARRLGARGHDVRVVTTDLGVAPSVPREQWVEQDGYRIYRARTRAANRVVPYWVPMLRRPLDEALAGADVLCMNVGLTLTNALARRVASRHAVPYVYNAEGALCPYRLALKGKRKRVFVRCFERRILRDAAALQAVTQKEVADLEALTAAPARIHLVPNGVELVPAPPSDGQRFRQRHGVDERARVVLFLGRVDCFKGVEIVIAALAATQRDLAELVFVVAGPSEGDSAARARTFAHKVGVADRVVFTGMLDATERLAALAAADVFVLASLSEGLPNAVLEAAAVGLPLIVTRQCNVPEVESFGAGLVIEPTPGAVADALRQFSSVADDEAARRMGAGGRRMVRERFAMPRVVEQLEDLYEHVARHRSHA